MQARWIGINFPLVLELAVFVEHLDAVIVSIGHEHVTRLRIDGDPMHIAEVAGVPILRSSFGPF
jgi:hypothetical protein